MNNLIYNSVDVIYLENNSNLNKFVSNIDKLNSDYIEVQLSKDFSNISLYKSIYEAIKPLNKGILLNIPESCIVSDLNIKQSDSVMIRYEINKLKLPEILDYCSVNNIRCCLRISYTKDIQDILQWKVKYPSLMIFLRMENIDFNIAYNMLGDNALYLDMPLCIIDKYKINSSLKALYDVNAFLDDSGYYKADKYKFLEAYNKRKSVCKYCIKDKECFGYLKDNESISSQISCIDKNIQHTDISIINRILNNKATDIKVASFNAENLNACDPEIFNAINQMQKTRLERKFSGKNFYYIIDVKKSFYFNRPLTEEPLFKKDPRGLMSLNWRFIGIDNPDMLWKQKCDLLLPEHGFVIMTQVVFDKYWTEEQQEQLDNFTLKSIQEIILDHGGDPNKLEQSGNDLLYNGKKFCGKEWLFVKNLGYIENTVVTCMYEPEKNWFNQLYHHKNERVITGITEEVPECTKNVLLKGLRNKGLKFFRGY